MGRIRDRAVAGVLVMCLAVVGFWEVMASRSRRPWDAFELTASSFTNFEPFPSGWEARKLPVEVSPIEPNVLALELRQKGSGLRSQESGLESGGPPPHPGSAAPVLVRLAHGYNMPDCMRIKGYRVEELLDGIGDAPGRVAQVWRLTSDIGDVSIWVTSMIRTVDFEPTGIDVRTMAFPRIGTPDDPRWMPRGMTWRSLRHPIRNFRWLIRSKWNNARCDLGTFLKLKRPAWADDSLMTLVSLWHGTPLKEEQEEAATAHVLAAHSAILPELQSWRRGGTATHLR